MNALVVTVPGVPAPQGSMVHYGRGRPMESSNKDTLLPWRAAVVAHIRQQMQRNPNDWPITGPVALSVTFRLPRPKSAPKRRWPDRKPDLDKLVRAAGDCLGSRTGAGAIHDDAQVVRIETVKEYGLPGMTLVLRALELPTAVAS